MQVANRRRALVFGAGTVAALLGLTSAAFACTSYYGKLTVSDVDANGVTWSASADGNGGIHGYCPVPADGVPFPQRVPIDLTGAFTVAVGTTTTCADNNSMADSNNATGTFDVKWVNVPVVPEETDNPLPVCIAADTFEDLGDVTLSSSGAGNLNATLPAGNALGVVDICLAPDNASLDSPPEVRLYVI